MSDPGSQTGWQELIITERIEVDRQFQERIQESALTHQAWELIMTAVEFRIEGEDPAEATLVADLSLLESVLPTIARIQREQADDIAPPSMLDRLLGWVDSSRRYAGYRREAEQLTTAYANDIQAALESNGRWPSIVERAAGT